MDNIFFFHGHTEPLDVEIVGEAGLSQAAVDRYRSWHLDMVPKTERPVSLLGFGVDHGLGAHSGNGGQWRTTVVAVVRLDYLRGQPVTYVRLEGAEAAEQLASLANAVAIRGRKV